MKIGLFQSRGEFPMRKSLTLGCVLLALASTSASAFDGDGAKIPVTVQTGSLLDPMALYPGDHVPSSLQPDWKFSVNLHPGLDFRSEKLTSAFSGILEGTSLNRSWVRAGVGYSASVATHPFVRLEVAAPLGTPAKGDTPDELLRKATVPSFQVALYGGIRF